MISLKRICLLLALFITVAYGENDGSKVSKIKVGIIVHEVNLSKTFDNALPRIQHYITKNGFDPIDIPDIDVPLSPLPGLLRTKMQLHHGHMQELSTIYRTGDIILQWTDEKMSIYLNIGFKTLDLSHEYTLKYMLYSRTGDCYGRYRDVKASMLVDVDLTKHKINLKFFKFIGVGAFELKLEGHFADKFLNMLSSAVTTFFRNEVLEIIESKTYDEIDRALRDINEIIPEDIEIIIKEIIKDQESDDLETYKSHRIGWM